MRLRTTLFLACMTGLAVLSLAQGISPALRIISPKAGEKTANNYVNVQYELAAPATASSAPTFRVQLDGHDPIETTDTQYTFTGLAPGAHVVSIVAVDANSTPINGTQAQVEFSVAQPQVPPPGPKSPGAQLGTAKLVDASYRSDANPAPAQANDAAGSGQRDGAPDETGKLPSSGSGLPLLSVIGMGVLVGGIASALRTRPSSSR